MATHSSVLAWRIPGTGEPGGLPFMGSHRVRHDWSDLAAAAALLVIALDIVTFFPSISQMRKLRCRRMTYQGPDASESKLGFDSRWPELQVHTLHCQHHGPMCPVL